MIDHYGLRVIDHCVRSEMLSVTIYLKYYSIQFMRKIRYLSSEEEVGWVEVGV